MSRYNEKTGKKVRTYSDNLPRKIRYKKDAGGSTLHPIGCQQMDSNGSRCHKMALYEVILFSEPEIRDEKLAWAVCYVCENHLPDNDRAKIEERRRK